MNLDEQLRALLADRAEAGQAPAPDFDALMSGGLVRRRRRRLAVLTMQGVTVLVVMVTALVVDHNLPAGHGAEPRPAVQPAGPFVGNWASHDPDGSHQTMTIRVLVDGAYEMVLRDTMTGPCQGPSTDRGTGTLIAGELVINGITTDCQNDKEPVGAGDTLTFVDHPRRDTLTDNGGVVWSRR
jgi:hypothetical protein